MRIAVIAIVLAASAVRQPKPKPNPRPVAPPTCRPSDHLELHAKLIEISVSGRGTIIVLDRGARDGVAAGDYGALQIGGKDVSAGCFRISRVNRLTAQAVVKRTPDELAAIQGARIVPGSGGSERQPRAPGTVGMRAQPVDLATR